MHMHSLVICFVCDADIKEPNASTMPFNAIANVMRSHCDMYAPNFFPQGELLAFCRNNCWLVMHSSVL